jgi:hypothetical protein
MVSLSSRISPFTSTVIFGQAAAGRRSRDFGRYAPAGQIAGHGVHIVGQILRRRLRSCLAAEPVPTSPAGDFAQKLLSWSTITLMVS